MRVLKWIAGIAVVLWLGWLSLMVVTIDENARRACTYASAARGPATPASPGDCLAPLTD